MNDLKILVVDDESRMRKLVKDFLNRAGYQVLEAGDGEEAVDVFFSDGRMGSRKGNTESFRSADYHADGQRSGKR